MLNYNEYKVGTINQLLMRIDLDDQSVYKIDFSGIANDFLNSYIGKTKVSINGEISSITYNGSLQVDIIENENQNKLFSAPLNVNNGKVIYSNTDRLDRDNILKFY